MLAAVALLLERGDVVGRFAAFGLGFLSGAYFPVGELVRPLRLLSDLLPTRVALDGQRAALAGGSWSPAVALSRPCHQINFRGRYIRLKRAM